MGDLESPCHDTSSPAASVTNEENEVGNGEPLPTSAETYDSHGSSISGAIFNFTNCIIGAGAIGLGGAFASSGGLISVASIVFFGILTKLSLDLVVKMSIDANGSYEELGTVAFGQVGWIAVLVSKFLYSFGCLVAYVIVIKDNMNVAVLHLLYGNHPSDSSWLVQLLKRDDVVTLLLSTFVILPLCCLRDMSSLSNLSAVSVVSMVFIVIIIIYLYFDNPGDSVRMSGGTVYENWFEIRPGYLESLGTFVFTFVSQHTVHLTYESIKSESKSLENWKTVSTFAISIATVVSLTVGLTVYCTFWQHAGSDLFEMYPSLCSIDFCKILLCLTMLLTFPLPFFTCRELMIVLLTHFGRSSESETILDDESSASLQEPLLNHGVDEEEVTERSISPTSEGISSRILVQGQEKQLLLPYHLGVTIFLWSITTLLAILAPSLGDVLDLVGCAAGTMIAFVLPGLFSFRLQGYTHLAAVILAVGGIVGLIGTVFSLQKLITDI